MPNREHHVQVLPKAMDLVKSPLLQGVGLDALQQFFAAMVKGGYVSPIPA